MQASSFDGTISMILMAVSLGLTACDRYYLGPRPFSLDATTREIPSSSETASEQNGGSEETGGSAGAASEEAAGSSAGGSEGGGRREAAGHSGTETGGAKNAGSRNVGGYAPASDAARSAKYGDDSPFDQDADCEDLCKAIASLQCEKGLSGSVCTRLCQDPESMTVPGCPGSDVQPYFSCAKGKVIMCNPDSGYPEPTDCRDSQPTYNLWYNGNQWEITNHDAGFR